MHGICPVCGETITVKLDGTLRVHGWSKKAEVPWPACAGSGQVPDSLCICDELG